MIVRREGCIFIGDVDVCTCGGDHAGVGAIVQGFVDVGAGRVEDGAFVGELGADGRSRRSAVGDASVGAVALGVGHFWTIWEEIRLFLEFMVLFSDFLAGI